MEGLGSTLGFGTVKPLEKREPRTVQLGNTASRTSVAYLPSARTGLRSARTSRTSISEACGQRAAVAAVSARPMAANGLCMRTASNKLPNV
jgi:hypothetical protein